MHELVIKSPLLRIHLEEVFLLLFFLFFPGLFCFFSRIYLQEIAELHLQKEKEEGLGCEALVIEEACKAIDKLATIGVNLLWWLFSCLWCDLMWFA